MAYDIVVGRDEADLKEFGKKGTIYIGRGYVKMGQVTSLSNRILLDVNRSHVILISGKRGSGKSYSGGVIAEEISNLPEELAKNISVLIFDTMGIFWTMKYENEKDEKLLDEWGMKPKGLDVNIYTPAGFYKKYKDEGIPTDFSFTIKPNELNASDWANVFGINLNDPVGIIIEKAIDNLKGKDYDIEDIIKEIKNETTVSYDARNAAENRFNAVKNWGLFGREGFKISEIIKPGEVSIIDISCYTYVAGNWSIKALVIGLICRKLLVERMAARKEEEFEALKQRVSIFEELPERKYPLLWIFLDEAHEFLAKEGTTPATDALVQLLREGRQPGISLVLATQQPGEIHKDVLTQSDLVISHRLTAKPDIEALNVMMQSYLIKDLQQYLNDLPDLKGSAIILDDNSERIYPMRVRPRFSWHGGEAPSVLRKKRELDLGLE